MLVDVLIVEDEPVVAESAARILQGADLTVRLALDAPSALAELEHNSVKVVLCDLMLPGESGLRVLEAARDLRPQAQVIMVTGYATCDNALESFKMGAFDFLPKPFDVSELMAPVTRGLGYFDRAGTRKAEELGSAPEGRADIYRLGRHAWATRDADGSATLGLGETFQGLLGPDRVLELPQPNEHTHQCRSCARIRTSDPLDHRVWAPLSGRVIAVNSLLMSDPDRIDREPWQACWLVRIVPESPVEERAKLLHF